MIVLPSSVRKYMKMGDKRQSKAGSGNETRGDAVSSSPNRDIGLLQPFLPTSTSTEPIAPESLFHDPIWTQ